MGTSFQHHGLRAINPQNSLNWYGVSRATLVKGKRGWDNPLFLIHLCQTGPKPHTDWSTQRAETQPYRHAPVSMLSLGTARAARWLPRACGATRGMSATILPPASELPNHRFTFWPAASYTPHQTVIVNAGKNISEGHLPRSRESIWKLLMWKDATQHQCATRSKQADQKSSGWTIFCHKITIWWKAKGFPPPPDPELLFSFQHIRHDPPKSFWQPKFKGFQV